MKCGEFADGHTLGRLYTSTEVKTKQYGILSARVVIVSF
jgi:hypothetical protein